MADLTQDEESWLNNLFEVVDGGIDKLNSWEKGFIADQRKRYEERGSKMWLSDKQKSCLRKIEDVATIGRNA